MSIIQPGEISDGILRTGDVVVWHGGFGMDKPRPAVVTAIEITLEPREKQGEDVDAVAWSVVRENRVVVSIGETGWAYGEQIFEATVEACSECEA